MEYDLPRYFDIIHKPDQDKPWLEFLYKEASDIHKLIELSNDLTNLSCLNEQRQSFFFRGQADSEWFLQPKIYRLLKGIKKEWMLRLEYDSIIYFKQHAPLFLSPNLIPEDKKIGEWLALMQQYSAPTRMLDWTTSFYVALYFTVTDQPFDKTGAVWFFEVHKVLEYMKKYELLSKEEMEDIIRTYPKT